MKNLFILAITLFSLSFITVDSHAQDHFKEVLGTVKDGKATLTGQKNNMMKSWSSILKEESNLNVNFSKIEILKIERQYVLVARSARYVSKTLLVEDKGNLYVKKRDDGYSITCTTSGCSNTQGCLPVVGLTQCSNCDADCKKTISIKSID